MRKRTVTGYLTNVRNPNFSGIATVVIRGRRDPAPLTIPGNVKPGWRLGKVTEAYTDAGSGVRWLARIFDNFSRRGQHMKARFTLGSTGLIMSVQVLDDGEPLANVRA